MPPDPPRGGEGRPSPWSRSDHKFWGLRIPRPPPPPPPRDSNPGSATETPRGHSLSRFNKTPKFCKTAVTYAASCDILSTHKHYPFILFIFSVICLAFWEVFIFVLRKTGSKTKKRMKEEEIEKGDCGRQPQKSSSPSKSQKNISEKCSHFCDFCFHSLVRDLQRTLPRQPSTTIDLSCPPLFCRFSRKSSILCVNR